MIRFARPEDAVRIRALWLLAFPMEQKMAGMPDLSSLENILVDEEDGDMVAMLFMSPYDAMISGKRVHGCYLHSLATLFDYRGRGIMTSLIEEAVLYGRASGYEAFFLIPGEEDLIPFYEKRGFTEKFYQRELFISGESAGNYVKKLGSGKKIRVDNADPMSREEMARMYQDSQLQAKKDRMMLTPAQFLTEVDALYQEGYDTWTLYQKDMKIGFFMMKQEMDPEEEQPELLITLPVFHPDYAGDVLRRIVKINARRIIFSEPVGKLPGKHVKNLISLGRKL